MHAALSCPEPAATWRFLKIPPVLVHLPSYLNVLIASFRIHITRSGPPGATVNQSWLEADDNKMGAGCQQQHVSFNDKSSKADNLRRGWMRGFQAFLREQQLVVALSRVYYSEQKNEVNLAG